MSWFRKFFKKATVVEQQVVKSAHHVMSRIKHWEFPKKEFKAYFETLMHMDHHGNMLQGTGVVRFYEHGSGKLLSYSTFQHKDQQVLRRMLDDHIEQQMKSYKR